MKNYLMLATALKQNKKPKKAAEAIKQYLSNNKF